MIDSNAVTLSALRIRQPIGDFYIGVIDAKALVAIAWADVRELKRDLDSYIGIQRRLDAQRVGEISAYVKTKDATFPTSILLAVPGECATWNEEKNQLTLRSTAEVPLDKIAKILDGQHRVAGLESYQGEPFQLSVSIFVDAAIADQANIFATVNLAQTKVNKSLVYDLFDYQRVRSPQKSAHNIAVAFDSMKDGPFFQRIKRLGYATAGRPKETLTQATVVEELLSLITPNAQADRDILQRGKKVTRPDHQLLKKYPFRQLFIDEKDADIALIVHSYFEAVRDRWPHAWKGTNQGQILPKTNGFKALMQFLKPAYVWLAGDSIGRIVNKQDFSALLLKVKLEDSNFTTELFLPGSSGQSTLKKYLMDALPKG